MTQIKIVVGVFTCHFQRCLQGSMEPNNNPGLWESCFNGCDKIDNIELIIYSVIETKSVENYNVQNEKKNHL